MSREWVIIEKDGDSIKALGGTTDPKAINRALAALKQYKDERVRMGGLDLTLINSAVVEDLKQIQTNEILEEDQSDNVARLLSMVGGFNEKTNII